MPDDQQPSLDDGDRALLRDCPFELRTFKHRNPTQAEAARARRVKRLWHAGFIGGTVVSSDHISSRLQVVLKDKGRIAIGRQPLGEAPT